VKIIPALYLKEGRAVLLPEGRLDQAEVVSENPVELAEKFLEQGAEEIHVVDLDGAQQGGPRNQCQIQQIINLKKLKVQVGGGIRDIVIARNYLHAGARAIVVSTAAVTNPYFVSELLGTFGSDRVVISLDVRENRLAISGWEEESGKGAHSVLARLIDKGARRFVYTDIERRRSGVGPDARTLKAFTRQDIEVTVSCSTAGEEILKELAGEGVDRVILDKALYEGHFEPETLWR